MKYVWEEEWARPGVAVPVDLRDFEWHLKHVTPQPAHDRFWKVSLAVVRRLSERKYSVWFVRGEHSTNDKTFRSLKAAKAYAVAIVTLEN